MTSRHNLASRLAMQGTNDRTLMGHWVDGRVHLCCHDMPILARRTYGARWGGLTAFQGQISDGTLTKTVTEVEGGEREDEQPIDISGEPRATRTLGPRLKRAMLYQLS